MRNFVKSKWIIISFMSVFLIYSNSCKEDVEESLPEKFGANEVVESEAEEIDTTGYQSDSNEFQRFIDRYSNLFVKSRIDSFRVPDYDYFEKYQLTEITDTSFTSAIYESAMVDWYEAKTYYYSIENRLNNLQDFTVLILNSYSYNIIYCILDNDNNLVSTLSVAYQFSEGEYSEYASGKFTNNLKYHLYIEGVAEPFEDIDGLMEGSETKSEKIYMIDEAGMIEVL